MNNSSSPNTAVARTRRIAHPLELLPGFGRWPASPGRDALYTVIFSSLVALVLVAIQAMVSDPSRPLGRYFVVMLLVSNLCGLFIHGGMALLNFLFHGWPQRARGLPRVLLHIVVSVVSVMAGVAISNVLLSGGPALHLLATPAALIQCTLIAAVIAVFMLVVRRNAERRIQAAQNAARQKELEAATARLLAEARLRALQAQIEPHFLYNTLANVMGLIGPHPDQARYMLERFIDYLRASLDTSRSEATTLGDEARLLAAYLDVLTVRMGARLRYRIDVPAALHHVAIAPMLLQPMVENAISHGLEPKVEGGEVTINASIDNGLLHLVVSDTGVGLDLAAGAVSRKPGGGVGLGNLRERLRSLYGAGASVALLENQPCGMLVRIAIPVSSLTTNPTS
jgi:signal transduction histidine kinase